MCAAGAYRLRIAVAARQVVIMATGSEVSLACEVGEALEAQGVGADVISMPSWEAFAKQPTEYRADLLPADTLKVSIEAGVTQGWERFIGPDGLSFGIDRFGASAPAEALYDYFGLTVAKITPQILDRLSQ